MNNEFHTVRWLPVQATVTLWPYDVVEIKSVGYSDEKGVYYTVGDITDGEKPIAIVGPFAVTVGAWGVATMDMPAAAALTLGLSIGDEIGPDTSPSHAMTATGVGYRFIGYLSFSSPNGTVGMIERMPDTGYKKIVDFSLSSTLTALDYTGTAVLTTQYGPGRTNSTSPITVYNYPVSGGGYQFYGAAGHMGRAHWIGGNNYAILNMECP